MKKLFYILILILFCLTGCKKEINVDSLYEELEEKKYNVQRCYKYDEQEHTYEYEMLFELEFLKDKQVRFTFKEFNCTSDICYNDLEAYYYLTLPVTNIQNESDTFNYSIEGKDEFNIVFKNKDDGTYLNINDIKFNYESHNIKNFGVGSECLDIKTLIKDEKPIQEDNVSDEYHEIDNVYAELCASTAVKKKLSRYSHVNVDVSNIMVNDKTENYIVKGKVSYKNEYNAKINYNFTCQIKNLSTCETSILFS